MKDQEVDRVLEDAARAEQGVPEAVLAHIDSSIQGSLHPVRPAPGAWVLTAGLLLLCATVAFVGAMRAGFYGFEARGVWERWTILAVLASLAGVVSRELVSQWTPGGRHFLTPGGLVALVTAILLGMYTLLFGDYDVTRFLSAGVICLSLGVLQAIPAAGLAAWALRRGLAVEPLSAGAMAGTFGGLSGVCLLELHCPNLAARHVLVWHAAVVPVSAVLGALVGWAVSAFRKPRVYSNIQ
jgi:hypothetical protein